jgi:UDP-glucose 4-epimerase
VGTINVLRATEDVGVERLIYYETALRYGLVPMEQPITLTHPTVAGGSSYAISKTGGEQYIQMSRVDHIIFVLANAYGPRNISGPLPTFFQRLTAGKPCFVMDTRRDFIYIADLVDITMRALAGMGQAGAYHVSSGSDHAIKELFDATVAALDIELDGEVEVRDRSADDVYTILLDPAKTERDFDWKISTPLAQGIKEAVAYYREHGITETFTHLKLDE